MAVLARRREVVGELGREALELISLHRPDVALLDVGMPGMNGIEIARQSGRASPKTKRTSPLLSFK